MNGKSSDILFLVQLYRSDQVKEALFNQKLSKTV